MRPTVKPQSGTTVEVRHGDEGPRHDPYSWTEVTVTRSSGEWCRLHTGLAVWMEYPARHAADIPPSDYSRRRGLGEQGVVRVDAYSDEEEAELLAEFERRTGGDPGFWMHWRSLAESRCPSCGKGLVFIGKGYVGEGVYGCVDENCNGMRYGEVTERMIE